MTRYNFDTLMGALIFTALVSIIFALLAGGA